MSVIAGAVFFGAMGNVLSNISFSVGKQVINNITVASITMECMLAVQILAFSLRKKIHPWVLIAMVLALVVNLILSVVALRVNSDTGHALAGWQVFVLAISVVSHIVVFAMTQFKMTGGATPRIGTGRTPRF